MHAQWSFLCSSRGYSMASFIPILDADFVLPRFAKILLPRSQLEKYEAKDRQTSERNVTRARILIYEAPSSRVTKESRVCACISLALRSIAEINQDYFKSTLAREPRLPGTFNATLQWKKDNK